MSAVQDEKALLDDLEAQLALISPDAMSLSLLDGFVAGLKVCPDPVPPEQWMPIVVNPEWSEQDTVAPINAAGPEILRLGGLLMEHYLSVRDAPRAGRRVYEPLLDIDPVSDELMWEIWVEGFAHAVTLRPDALGQLGKDSAGAAEAAEGLTSLAEHCAGVREMTAEQVDLFQKIAPTLFSIWMDE